MDMEITSSDSVPHHASSTSNRDEAEKKDDFPPASADQGGLQQTLSTRHLTMISLGSSIGLGLWLGSGTALRNGGPAGILIGYILAGTMAWSVMHGIGEMAILYPVPAAFVQWSSTFISPSVGFAVGWTYACAAFVAIANELQGIVTVLHFWTHDVPPVAWITVFWVVIILINIWAVRLFAETEVVFSTIKFGWIFVVIISLIVISAGGAPHRDAIGFRYWNAKPFTNGFKGCLSVMPSCIFAMSGIENVPIVAAETSNPQKAIPHAVGSLWMRLTMFYLLGALSMTLAVGPYDRNLFGGDGANNSPFVVAYQNAGLPVLAHIMNAVIFISVLSTASIFAYGGSRRLVGLSQLGMAPKIFARADKVGRPVAGLFVILLPGGGLAYLNLSSGGVVVLSWLSNLLSLLVLFVWGTICLSHLRMRYAWKIQGRSESELPWRTWTYPYTSCWGLAWCIILIICEFYLSVWPLHKSPNVRDFFANYSSVILVIVVYLGGRCWYRDPWWVDASTIDLDRWRRFYVQEDEEQQQGRKHALKKFRLRNPMRAVR